jgi:hypothetical protein
MFKNKFLHMISSIQSPIVFLYHLEFDLDLFLAVIVSEFKVG